MKILYLSRALLPSEISNSLSIMRVCQAFADRGHEVLLTGLASRKKTTDPITYYGLRGGFKVLVFLVSRLWDNRFTQPFLIPGLVLAWKTRSIVKSFAPDIIYSRLTLTELALIPRHLPIYYEMHSLSYLRGTRMQQSVFRWLLRHKNVHRIVVTTELMAKLLQSELLDTDIKVAHLSAEHPVIVTDEMLTSFRSLNLQGENFKNHVGYTGYLDTIGLRGTEIICQTAAKMPATAFHIVGGEQEIVEHWRRYAEDYNIHGNIFFYGHRNPSDMPLFLGCFDVVLAPLQHKIAPRAPTGMNMSPLKLPQYMSYKKAIVASDLPSHREVLTDGETALLVPPKDIDAWVSGIRLLLDDHERRTMLGNNAVNRYWSDFSPEVRVRQILDGIHASEPK